MHWKAYLHVNWLIIYIQRDNLNVYSQIEMSEKYGGYYKPFQYLSLNLSHNKENKHLITLLNVPDILFNLFINN